MQILVFDSRKVNVHNSHLKDKFPHFLTFAYVEDWPNRANGDLIAFIHSHEDGYMVIHSEFKQYIKIDKINKELIIIDNKYSIVKSLLSKK